MKRWALIINGECATVVEQETQPTVLGTWVDVTSLHVGPRFLYDGSQWTAPPVEEP